MYEPLNIVKLQDSWWHLALLMLFAPRGQHSQLWRFCQCRTLPLKTSNAAFLMPSHRSHDAVPCQQKQPEVKHEPTWAKRAFCTRMVQKQNEANRIIMEFSWNWICFWNWRRFLKNFGIRGASRFIGSSSRRDCLEKAVGGHFVCICEPSNASKLRGS